MQLVRDASDDSWDQAAPLHSLSQVYVVYPHIPHNI